VDVEWLRTEVSRISWFHSIPLGHGIVTPGVDRSAERLATMKLPEDLRGKTVLDVGAWDGFFSFEAERRGASRVLATDSYCWSGEGWGSKAGFDLARTALGSQVEDKEIDVLELSSEAVGPFDIVLFLGVLYHMRHPLLALERVASVTRERLILDTCGSLVANASRYGLLSRGRVGRRLDELVGSESGGCRCDAEGSRLREDRGCGPISFVPGPRHQSRKAHAAQTRSTPSGPLASKDGVPRVVLSSAGGWKRRY